MLWGGASTGLETRENVLYPLPLLLILQVIDRRAEEEPDSVGEEKVDFAGSAQNLADLLHLDSFQLRVQVKRTELGDEELKVRSRGRAIRQEVRVKADPHQKVVSMRLVPVQLDESVEDLAINEPLFLQSFEGLAEIHDDTTFSFATLLVTAATVPDQATAKGIVGDPEDGSEH